MFYVFSFLPGTLLVERPSGTPSFVARRKIEEKDTPRRRKLHILRFAFRGKSSVVPLLLLSPPNPLRWALAGPLSQSRPLESCFYTGVRRGDVRASYEFAVMQFTRFRPVRGVLRTASTDSCLLHALRQMRNTYRITNVLQTWQSVGCAELDSSPSLRTSDRRHWCGNPHPRYIFSCQTAYKRLPRRTSDPRNDPIKS